MMHPGQRVQQTRAIARHMGQVDTADTTPTLEVGRPRVRYDGFPTGCSSYGPSLGPASCGSTTCTADPSWSMAPRTSQLPKTALAATLLLSVNSYTDLFRELLRHPELFRSGMPSCNHESVTNMTTERPPDTIAECTRERPLHTPEMQSQKTEAEMVAVEGDPGQ